MHILDFQNNGIGDVVLGCWIVHSAQSKGQDIHINPRRRADITKLLSIPQTYVTKERSVSFTRTEGLGYRHELATVGKKKGATRFERWCDSLGLAHIAPLRPDYAEDAKEGKWADVEWKKVDYSEKKKRVILFPETAWLTRRWPQAYWIDLARVLVNDGYAVAAMASKRSALRGFKCHRWWGHSLPRMAAMSKRAKLAVSNDSGPAHLAGTIGTKTLALCGPTDGAVVFGHDPNVTALGLGSDKLDCAPCHFSKEKGFRQACSIGGCQALMRLEPDQVIRSAIKLLGPANGKP